MLYQVSPFGRHDKALIIKELFGFLATLEILNVNPIQVLIIDIA
jgi:hypothetical protein